MKIILAAITLLAFPLSASAVCNGLNGNINLVPIITEHVNGCLGTTGKYCSFLDTPNISADFSNYCEALLGKVFYVNSNYNDNDCELPDNMPPHHVGFPLCMSTECTNEDVKDLAHAFVNEEFGTAACTAAIDVYTFPDDVPIQCAAALAKIRFHVYEEDTEWDATLVLDTTTNEYVWNEDAGDLVKFELICALYDGELRFGDLVHDCETIPAGKYNYKYVPICGTAACSDAEAIHLANFVEEQVEDCPLVASFE